MVIKSRAMRWVEHVAQMEEMKNSYKIYVGGPEWKKQFGAHRRRWDDNIRMDLRKIGWESGKLDSSGSG
jgi:hypothetical protein